MIERLPDPSAVLFDLDGTLVDTVGTRIEAWLRAFGEAGIRAQREHVAGLIGSDGKRLAREVASRTGRVLDDAAAERLDVRSGEVYNEMNRDPRALPGASALLAALACTPLEHAIVTSSRPEQVLHSVAALGLDAAPPIVDGSHVGQAKPAPDLLLVAAKRLATPVERCWYIGDATWDMLAAAACGMPAVGVATGAVDAFALIGAGAGATVRSLDEVERELRRRDLLPRVGGA